MTYISKSVEVDVEVEIEDVLDFIGSAYTTDKEREQIKAALKMDGAGESQAPFFIPVYMHGHASQLLALPRLEELINQMGVEEALTKLNA